MIAKRILSTKKLQPGQKQYLLNAGFSVVEADFIKVRPKEFDISNVSGDLIFTSGNAVASFIKHPESGKFRGANAYCVGMKTRQMLAECGINVVGSADSAAALGDLIMESGKSEFTFLSGNLRLDALPMSLKINGAKFREIEVYETILTPMKISSTPDGILFFSPSGVNSFLKENEIGETICFCIGATTADALKGLTENVVMAQKPSVENVIVQCINNYKEKSKT